MLYCFPNKIFSFYLGEKSLLLALLKSVKIKIKNWGTTGASKSQSMGIDVLGCVAQFKKMKTITRFLMKWAKGETWDRCKNEGHNPQGIWFNFE